MSKLFGIAFPQTSLYFLLPIRFALCRLLQSVAVRFFRTWNEIW
jgi:hypothetical protein